MGGVLAINSIINISSEKHIITQNINIDLFLK